MYKLVIYNIEIIVIIYLIYYRKQENIFNLKSKVRSWKKKTIKKNISIPFKIFFKQYFFFRIIEKLFLVFRIYFRIFRKKFGIFMFCHYL